jgi:restriction system protein
MNFLDTAYEVLKQAGKPLHYIEITRRGQATGLLDTKGQTPEASMGSRLYVDTKRPDSRFRRVSRGVFALAASQPSDISQRIAAINQQTRRELHQRLLNMPPDRFEVLVSQLLTALGFEEETIEVTPYSGDGGIDVRGVLNAAGITRINAAVQAKRWKSNIHTPAIQALRGSLTVHQQGIFMTTSKFSKGAIAEAEAVGKTPISLIDGDRLVELLIEHEIGVVTERYAVHSLDVEWWGDVAGEDEIELPPELPMPPAVSYPLLIQATLLGQTVRAELLDARGRTRFNGAEYQSPSGAGKAASGWKACDGWRFWRYQHPETGEWRAIDELRVK